MWGICCQLEGTSWAEWTKQNTKQFHASWNVLEPKEVTSPLTKEGFVIFFKFHFVADFSLASGPETSQVRPGPPSPQNPPQRRILVQARMDLLRPCFLFIGSLILGHLKEQGMSSSTTLGAKLFLQLGYVVSMWWELWVKALVSMQLQQNLCLESSWRKISGFY